MVERGLGLVYGGATPGLMGAIADTVLGRGGQVIGVIPNKTLPREVAHQGLTKLHLVGTMQERKLVMMDLADAFVVLPGGYGTLDEVSEVATSAQLRLHSKPCGLLNVERFFDPLLAYLDNAVQEGFLKPNHRSLIQHADDPVTLLDRLCNNHDRQLAVCSGGEFSGAGSR